MTSRYAQNLRDEERAVIAVRCMLCGATLASRTDVLGMHVRRAEHECLQMARRSGHIEAHDEADRRECCYVFAWMKQREGEDARATADRLRAQMDEDFGAPH